MEFTVRTHGSATSADVITATRGSKMAAAMVSEGDSGNRTWSRAPWIAQDLPAPHAWSPASCRTPARVTLDWVGLSQNPFLQPWLPPRLVRAWSFRGGAAGKEELSYVSAVLISAYVPAPLSPLFPSFHLRALSASENPPLFLPSLLLLLFISPHVPIILTSLRMLPRFGAAS